MRILDLIIEKDSLITGTTYQLNRLQIFKRKRKLLDEEISLLNTIVAGNGFEFHD
jgi:hypothetical protein